MLNLSDVTLSCVVGRPEFFKKSYFATLHSCKNINFASVQLLSCVEFYHPKIKHVKMPEFTLDDYNKFMIEEYDNYVNSDFVLHIQYDGFILNPNSWEDSFKEYDYIGALWPVDHQDDPPVEESSRVGNGGFTLRSKKLLSILKENFKYDPSISKRWNKPYNEDALICRKWKTNLEQMGIKFAPNEVAAKFSIENESQQEYNGQSFSDFLNIKTFGFHNKKVIISNE